MLEHSRAFRPVLEIVSYFFQILSSLVRVASFEDLGYEDMRGEDLERPSEESPTPYLPELCCVGKLGILLALACILLVGVPGSSMLIVQHDIRLI